MNMTSETIKDYFEKNWLLYQIRNGRGSQNEYANYLGVSRTYLTQLLNGKKKSVGRKTTIDICKKTGDWSLCDILGYARPESQIIALDHLPEGLQLRLRDALDEIELTLRTRAIQPDSEEGEAISSAVLKKFLFNTNENE